MQLPPCSHGVEMAARTTAADVSTEAAPDGTTAARVRRGVASSAAASVQHESTLAERVRNRVAREFAMEMSLASLGSSHTLRSPQLSTEAASRFCNFRDTMAVPTAAAPAELSQRGSSSVAFFARWRRRKPA